MKYADNYEWAQKQNATIYNWKVQSALLDIPDNLILKETNTGKKVNFACIKYILTDDE